MCQSKTKEEMRDQAIGMLEEARDGLDSVLSEVNAGEELATTDSRIRKAMDLVDETKKLMDTLWDLVDERKNRVSINTAYSLVSAIFEPNNKLSLEQVIDYAQLAMKHLRNCKFPVKV